MITNPSCGLEKHQTLDFLLMTDFYVFVFKSHFLHLHNFRKSSAPHTKIIVCVLFYVTMLDQTQYSLISPFSNDNFFKTGVHFRFERETLKVI